MEGWVEEKDDKKGGERAQLTEMATDADGSEASQENRTRRLPLITGKVEFPPVDRATRLSNYTTTEKRKVLRKPSS